MNACIQNIYENNPHYSLVDVKPVTGQDIQKLIYRDRHCIIWKVAQVALAALVTLVTLSISLFFLKGRQLWTNALDRFKDHIFLENIIPPAIQGTTTPANPLQLKKDEILNDNPDWKITVDGWENISLVDQVWVLQVFELRKIGIHIPSLDSIMSLVITPIVDAVNIGKVLSQRKDIEIVLAEIKSLDLSLVDLEKYPDAISLLPNLKNYLI